MSNFSDIGILSIYSCIVNNSIELPKVFTLETKVIICGMLLRSAVQHFPNQVPYPEPLHLFYLCVHEAQNSGLGQPVLGR